MIPSAVRRWLNRPKKSDPRLMAKFFHVDEEVGAIIHEMHCMEMHHDAGSYMILLSHLHNTQDSMLALIEQMLERVVPKKRRRRDYHWKFTDENLPGHMTAQLLFAAELMVGGTYIEVQEADGVTLRPVALELLHGVMELRNVLREQSLEDPGIYPEHVQRALVRYDHLCAEFEFRYTSLLLNVKTPEEVYEQQEVAVLFCETVYSGLLIYPDGPLGLHRPPEEMCELFSPFYGLLRKIKALLITLSEVELHSLESALCLSSNDPAAELSSEPESPIVLPSPSQSEGLTGPELSPLELFTNSEHCPENFQVVSCNVNMCQSAVLQLQVSPNMLDSGTIDDPESHKSSEKSTRDQNSASIVQCVMKRSIERHGPHARKPSYPDARSHYHSNEHLLHRLFVCISGVADQLQTNFAGELRIILKAVFDAVSSKQDEDERTAEDAFRVPGCRLCQNQDDMNRGVHPASPEWVPDGACIICTTCCAPFTLMRRRHHCRRCGNVSMQAFFFLNIVSPLSLNTSHNRICLYRFFAPAAPHTQLSCLTNPARSLFAFAPTATMCTAPIKTHLRRDQPNDKTF
uniref:FYVE zinc finger domain-containing protein n=1 Tax=Leptobrachium leishanense TaxID=445787 RepID=A0A8C5M5Y2_9ANUR